MKTLYLVRHAKSSWDNQNLRDIERPLNHRGNKNAPEMGSRLAARGVTLDYIISSPANRARSTAEYLAEAVGYDSNAIDINDLIYFDGVSSMLDVIQNTPESIQSLMLVGHNPDMTSLCHNLCGQRSMDMPTCAIATLQFEGSWRDLDYKSAELVDYDFPKKQ